jgi:hypothetical protein
LARAADPQATLLYNDYGGEALGGDFGVVFGIEIVADGGDLTKLKLGEAQTSPAFRGEGNG